MTLMEAVVALVILSLAAVGCLELAQGASQLEYSATQWNAAVTVAESRMAQLVAGVTDGAANAGMLLPSDSARQQGVMVSRESYRSGLDLVSVSVPVTDGKRYVLRRLLPSGRQHVVSIRR